MGGELGPPRDPGPAPRPTLSSPPPPRRSQARHETKGQEDELLGCAPPPQTTTPTTTTTTPATEGGDREEYGARGRGARKGGGGGDAATCKQGRSKDKATSKRPLRRGAPPPHLRAGGSARGGEQARARTDKDDVKVFVQAFLKGLHTAWKKKSNKGVRLALTKTLVHDRGCRDANMLTVYRKHLRRGASVRVRSPLACWLLAAGP